MFRQLREYRILNGDCNVPQKYQPNPKLGKWVSNQRMFYRNLKEGKKGGTVLSQERVARLEGLGMNWGKKFAQPASWEDQYEEVKKYKSALRCDPPVNLSNPTPVAIWVSNQRKEYRRFKKGRDSLLTTEKIGQLNDLGFDWKGPRLA